MAIKENQVEGFTELIKTTRLKDVMRYPPIVIRKDDKFSMVEKILRESKIKHLPVVDNAGKLCGIITLSDLYRTCAPRRNVEDGTYFYDPDHLDTFILEHVMSSKLVTLEPDNSLMEAMHKMVEGGMGCMPVINQKHMIEGIITQTDVVRILTEKLQKNA